VDTRNLAAAGARWVSSGSARPRARRPARKEPDESQRRRADDGEKRSVDGSVPIAEWIRWIDLIRSGELRRAVPLRDCSAFSFRFVYVWNG
jgi:hypothetical protein